MMKPLRRRHLQIWTAWAVLLPAGIVFAWLAIPDSGSVKLLQSPIAEVLPVIKRTSDKKEYTVNLRSNNENSEWQLEWKNKLPLVVPSAVIYKAPLNPPEGGTLESFEIKDALLIGRIEARGDYVFSLPNDSADYTKLKLVLYDFIHQKVIDTINFRP